MHDFKLLIHSARQVVQVVNNRELVLKGTAQSKLAVLEKSPQAGEGFSVLVDNEGLIASIGLDSEVNHYLNGRTCQQRISAQGYCVLPGLVDGHTHPVWTGDRVHEFSMKLAGATYMDIHEAGGGIHYTVDCVRNASEDELYEQFKGFAQRMIKAGTTLAECKSGYGLNTNTEMKMLKVLQRAKNDPEIGLDISSTYCGAHAVPRGSTADEATDDILNEQLPKLRSLMASGELQVDNIDVFCEKGVFDVEQSRRILSAGQELGLAINFHGEELNRLGSAEMGSEIGARAISHLEEISDEGISAMGKSDTIAVLLPSTAYILRLEAPPARKMIEAGVAVALGSDFNPNAHCLAMPVIMHLACIILKMNMAEALVASTLNAAASLGKSDTHGSIEVGKQADIIILKAPRWEHLIYQLGGHSEIISHVIHRGDIVYSN